MKVVGQLVDIHKSDIYPVVIYLRDGSIYKIEKTDSAPDTYILPGLIDAHIHIESSMITPGAFAMAAIRWGTTGVISDPHEIANILGLAGVKYMIDDAAKVPLRFWFGASSCVPATSFETSGASLSHIEIEKLMELDEIKYLAEMMNFPGVIFEDKEVAEKLLIARKMKKPVDGHAPGLTGDMLRKYVAAGISTDHECSSYDEAIEKISFGMKILIREGSAARNLDSLKELFKTNPEQIMLCSDDLHPEMLMKGHINKLIARLITDGYNIFDVIRSATINPVNHYNIEAGLLRQGESADFIIVDDLKKMNVLETWIRGEKVFGEGRIGFSYKPAKAINNFNCLPLNSEYLKVFNVKKNIRVIEAFDGELLTREIIVPSGNNKVVESNTSADILKIVVKNRYSGAHHSTGFIKGFGLKRGAFASSIAHDSHNIISVGTNDKDITNAINQIVHQKGGLAVSTDEDLLSLELNIGGIMTTRSCEDVARDYNELNEKVRSMGCKMKAPFMTLSFMALLVIPDLKIGDQGLFDVKKFELVSLFL
jgi:adenine deaminase